MKSDWKELLTGQWGASRHPEKFFDLYGWLGGVPVNGDKIMIASGYGAQFKRWFEIPKELADSAEMVLAAAVNAKMEREAIARLLGNFELEYSRALKIEDRAGTDFLGSGDPTQLDCVDEAWNATVVLLWMREKKLLKFHDVLEPMAKMTWFVTWNHYAAILEEKETKVLWAVDGSVLQGGGDPEIVEADDWHNP